MICIVCLLRPAAGYPLCALCGASYDQLGGSMGDAIVWAANRARYFAVRRKRSR